jgi:hypothetical protein
MKKAIILLVIIASHIILLGTTYTVKQDGTGDFTNIQDAIDAPYVEDGDEIIVWPNDPDPYYENIDFNGKNIVVGSLFYIFQNPYYIQHTVIDGSEEGSVVTFNSGENSTAILSGFTIQNGLGANYPNHTGGGIDCHYSNPTLENLIISENSSGFAGGGIYCYQSSPLICNLSILNNITQQYGGGLTCDYYSCPTIEDVTIFGNLTLETWPFSDDLFVFGDSLGSMVPYDPESDRNPTSGGGICINGASNASLENVTIENNSSWGGAGVFCCSSIPSFFNVDVINNTTHNVTFAGIGGIYFFECYVAIILENVTVSGNIAYGCIGGIQCEDSNLTMINVDILDNTSTMQSGGINLSCSHVSMFNVNIIGNSATGFGSTAGGIYLPNSSSSSAILENVNIAYNSSYYGGGILNWGDMSLTNVNISHNSANFGAGIYCGDNDPLFFINSTIADNIASEAGGGIYCRANSNPMLTNSILWDNTPQEIYFCEDWEPNSITISYSDIQDGEAGIVTNNNGTVYWLEGNIDEDPLFENPGLDDYTLQWNEQHISPCIDSGDPSITDPDETPSDMGAFRAVDHDFHLTTAQHDRYRWRSFPVIDRVYVQQGFETTYICAPVEDQTDYFKIFDQEENEKVWIPDYWSGELNDLDSVEGYKLRTNSDVEIPTSGITLAEDTRVYLDAGNNWVGYFVKESMGIEEAFAEIWDHITGLFGEDWAWAGTPHTRNTLIYGKMYIVRVDEACDFVYGEGSPVDPEEREMTEGFYYVETPEYSPINIESLDDPTVLEVGVFIDGECIGATQVEEFPLQILAFPAEGGRGSGDITFEFYCGGRSYKPAKEYKVLNKETGQYDNSKIELRPYEFTTICFGNPVTPAKFTLSGNYPNPFNPTTTISYSIPQDGNVKLVIFNIKGQKVKTLVEGSQPSGTYNVTWNGKDENDRSVSSGLYLYKLRSSEKTAVKKMLLLK